MTLTLLRSLELCLVVVLVSTFTVGRIQAAGAEDESIKEESVITLDFSNFTDFVSKHDFIFVEFYSPGYVFLNIIRLYERATELSNKACKATNNTKLHFLEDLKILNEMFLNHIIQTRVLFC